MHCLAGVRGYLHIIAVVIVKFKCLDRKEKYVIVSGGKTVAHAAIIVYGRQTSNVASASRSPLLSPSNFP